jgi:hypothetical protein
MVMAVQQFLAKNNIPTVPHPSYSPRPRTKWLLALPCAENGPSRTSFHNGGRHQRKRLRETARDQKKFSLMLQQLDRHMELMCVCVSRWKLLRRRLSL